MTKIEYLNCPYLENYQCIAFPKVALCLEWPDLPINANLESAC